MPSQTEAGKAFEFALLQTFRKTLSPFTSTTFSDDSSYILAKRCFNLFSPNQQINYTKAAEAATNHIIGLEPRLTNPLSTNDALNLKIVADSTGMKGDVRDVLFTRQAQNWEIGLSAKNNHSAVKHSRLSDKIDFGKEWLGIPCNTSYFQSINPFFTELRSLKTKNELWRNLANKHQQYYVPILNAFSNELKNLDKSNVGIVPTKLLSYLLGNEDFYKIIKRTKKTEVYGFNLHGTLNKSSKNIKPIAKVARLKLPTRIIDLSFKKNSTDTLFLFCDEGWQISFRIHNASSRVEPSLKFDINLVGQPPALYSHHISW